MGDKKDIVWITGASSGIGKSIAIEFLNHKVHVAASARRKSHLDSIVDEAKNSEYLHTYVMDVSDSTEVLKTYEKINEEFDITCLINNAGVTTFTAAADDTVNAIDEIIKVNLLGSIYTIKSVLPSMLRNKKGTIINIISAAAVKIFTESSAYSASKAGLLAYTNVLREEMRDSNLKIINVLPGATKTPIWPSEALEKYAGRMMSPNDLAKYVYQVYSLKSTVVPEELVLKPLKGDL